MNNPSALIGALLDACFCAIQDGESEPADAYIDNLTTLFPDVDFSDEQQDRYDWMSLHMHNLHAVECGDMRCPRCAA